MNGMEVKCDIIYRPVKHARIEIKNGSVRLIIPPGTENYQSILEKNKAWIYRKISQHNQRKIIAEKREIDFQRTEDNFKTMVINYMHMKSKILQVNVNKIRFRKMKSRWGSCSAERNISINTRLKYLPPKLIKYVCFHELAHLIERKHDKNFWKIIREEYHDYSELEDELSIYWLIVKEL